MSEKPRVGEILVRAGVIDEMQLSAALGEQARWGRRLGVTLIKMGMVEEGHLIRALAKQLDLPVVSLAGKRISDDVIALVPARVASDHGVIPLFVKREGCVDQLFLGMEDPSNLSVLDDLSFRTGMEVYPVMVGPTELGEAMDRYYLDGPSSSSQAKTGTPIGEQNLRVVTDGEATVGSSPQNISPVAPVAPVTPSAPSTPTSQELESPAVSQPSQEIEFELSEPVPTLPEGLLEDLAHALEETEKTRVVTKALAQLLIEKGILTLEEVQAQVLQQKNPPSS